MSIITIPAGLVAPASSTIGQARYDLTESSDSTGSEAARLLGPPRWSMSLRSIEAMTPAQAGQWEAMLLQLRGRVNHLAAYDFGRPAPAGTLRGTPTLNASASAGATSIVLAASGATLLAGDWLQLGTGVGTSQLVKCVANAASAGATMTVTIEPPLRRTFSAGTAVAWDKPVAYFKQTSAPSWSYRVGRNRREGGFVLDLLESWT